MSEIGELVSALDLALQQDKYCKGNQSRSKGWKSRINKWGTEKNCSATRLYKCMKKDKDKEQGYLPPPVSFVAKPGVTGYKWELNICQEDHFPLQAHHIIPKNHLPEHGVCAFLAKKYTGDSKFVLTGDTYYDTDHANNGYCMPYATPLKEWKRAKNEDEKIAICYKVMDKTRRQLHQGSHKAGSYEDPLDAKEEEAGIHKKLSGYLDTIDDFLDVVQSGAETHPVTCQICQPDKNKKEIQPLEAVVKHVDQVSGLVKLLLDANQIFISKVASWHRGRNKKKIKIPDWLSSSK